MPIDSKAGKEEPSVSKMQIKGVTMTTSPGSPSPSTCHTEFSVENQCTYLDTRAHHEPSGRWQGVSQRQSNNVRQSRTTRAKLHNNGTPMRAHSIHLLANS